MTDFEGRYEQNEKIKTGQKFSVQGARKTMRRILRYSGVRIITILLTIGLGLYLTLLIVNLGGYVDEIMEGQISERILGLGMTGAFDGMEEAERDATVEALRWQMEEAMGLHEPMAIRTARWWFRGITLQWGNTERLATADKGSFLVKDVIFERLPYTLLLVGAANVILFFTSLGTAMVLSSKRGKFWDRLFASLTPISSAPSWVHGVILLAIFALELRILPFKGVFDGAPPDNSYQYILQLARHMILPVSAIILSVFFQGVYTWRTFFIVHSGEDYVELAKAKGLPDRVIRRRYLLRPTLPSVITSFAMMLVSFWEGAIALEILFTWPGLGALFYRAIYSFDRPVVVGIVVLFSFILGITVLFLDIIYAVIDPRVRVGGNGASNRLRAVKKHSIRDIIKGFYRRKSQVPPQRSSKKIFNEELEIEEGALPKTKTQHSASFLKELFHTTRKQIFKYPMATIGLIVIVFLIFVAIGTVILIPYDEAVSYWHSDGWLLAPKLARPIWTNFFRSEKWPESIYFDSRNETEGVISSKEIVELNDTMTDHRMTFQFDYTADIFPQDLVIYFETDYREKKPFATLLMITPDGREVELKNYAITGRQAYILSDEDFSLVSKDGPTAVEELFGDPETDFTSPLKGSYQLQVLALTFEDDSTVDSRGVIHGKVYGLFGTDTLRRDLTIAMLWGTPVALIFGILGAVLTTTTTILLAAISAWYGGLLDEIIQRITEMNITLPALPIAILVFILYSKSIWVILAIMILINIFGKSLKEYRAMFLQFKEAPYIEAAIAYGSSNQRIIFKYMLPRIIQVVVPQLVISVPSFVFLEATLAYLGVETPYLPTWGKVINMALHEGAYWGYYFWVMEPIVLVLMTGLAFAFVGFALDKILNPRLRNL